MWKPEYLRGLVSNTKILGIDPCCTGGCATIATEKGDVKIFDTPVTNDKVNGQNRTLYQPEEMIGLIRQCLPVD